MVRLVIAVYLILGFISVKAQEIAPSDLDAAARMGQRRSVLFLDSNDQGQEQLSAIEEDMRRQAYEEQMRQRAYEEEMRRMEEERRKALQPVDLFGRGIKIFAEVNGEVITSRDMQDRVNVFVATTQIPVNAETKDMIIEKVLQSAIDEKIKLQEAQNNGIEIGKSDLDKGMENFARSNQLTVPALKKMLKEAHVSESVFKSQMKAEMAWGRLVQRKAAQEVQVSQGEIDRALKNITDDVKIEKYMVSEIVIPKKKADHIEDLVENLRHDPRFELYAMQFSESPSARNGGKLGWVNKGQLAQVLESALEKMSVGSISEPILVGSDYYILRLEQRYRPNVDKAPVPAEDEVRAMVESRKTEEIANKYLRQLRQRAIIEQRD